MAYEYKFNPGCEEFTENREFYEPGGFHPVNIGDTFQEYCVIHKLGYGGFATIWLARDARKDRNVALKIVAAENSKPYAEVEMLQFLATSDSSTSPGKSHISLLLDHFWIEGPNGRHLCMVFEPVGPSIAKLREDRVALSIDQAQKVALQASQGLAYLHSHGIVHGDFTAWNILCRLEGIGSWSEEEVYKRLGKPELETLELITGEPYTGPNGPRALVHPAELSKCFDECPPEDIFVSIIDFGEAFRSADGEVPEVGTPDEYRAPELLFGRKATTNSDIWALGCCIFEIRGSEQLFESFFSTTENIIRQVVQTFGKLPEPWWTEWDTTRQEYFDDDGEPRKDWDDGKVLAVKYPLERAIQDIGTNYVSAPRVGGVEARDLADLLHKMLKLRSEERISAEEALGHAWFNSTYFCPVDDGPKDRKTEELEDTPTKATIEVTASDNDTPTSATIELSASGTAAQ